MDKNFSKDLIYKNAFLLLNSKCNIKDEDNALLFDKLTYVIFSIAILPSNDYSFALLNELSKIYLKVKDIDMYWSFTQEFTNLINDSFYKLKEVFPLKKGIKVIAKIFRQQLINEPFRNGLEIGVLDNLIDLKNTPYVKEGLPYYSRIGLGCHSGMVANEEQQLLEDAFFMLLSAEKVYNEMTEYAFKIKNNSKNIGKEHVRLLTILNRNVCTLCRNGIINFFGYFEAFLNGIGLDYLYKNKAKVSKEERFLLIGKNKQGSNYIKMEDRIEWLQKIIGGKIIYKTKNHQQLKEECFVKLLNKFKNQRDISVHFSKEKGNILIPPDKWLSDLSEISKYVLEVSRKIWSSCYHDDSYPDYLKNFKYEAFYKDAEKRLNVNYE